MKPRTRYLQARALMHKDRSREEVEHIVIEQMLSVASSSHVINSPRGTLNLDGTKIGAHKDRVDAMLRGERVAPITIDMALTQKCSYACTFCVHPLELVLLADGSSKPMKNICVGDVIVSVDEGRLSESAVIAHWMTSTNEKLLSIETEGNRLRCTDNHPILTNKGWVKAGELKEGDYIGKIKETTAKRRTHEEKQPNARPRSGEAYGQNYEAAQQQKVVSFAKTTPRRRENALQKVIDKGETSPFRAYEKEQPHEKSRNSCQSPRPMDKRKTPKKFRSHEKEMGGRKSNICTSINDETKRDKQNRSKIIRTYWANGVSFCRRFRFLVKKYNERFMSKPRLYLEEWKKQNCSFDARPILAYTTECFPGDRNERLFRSGVENIYPLGKRPFIKKKTENSRANHNRMVIWSQIKKISDAGYSPVYDLECTPHHNFIASNTVVHNCYAGLQQNEQSPVKWEIYEQFLDDCAEIGVKAISLVSDGESTENPDLLRFIHKARENGLEIALGTNGFKLSGLREIVENLTYLRFNFDAADPYMYAEIMGTSEKSYFTVINKIDRCVRLKRETGSKITIGLQMVLLPEYADQVIPLALLGKTLGVDYFVIKHCSDDATGRLGVDYSYYTTPLATELLKIAEGLSTDNYQVSAKWSKIRTGRDRKYSRCYGPPLLLQMSGSGIVAPCGSFFHPRYKKYHIGDLKKTRFKDMWESDRYWEVMEYLASSHFDACKDCATLCVQDKVNEAINDYREGIDFPEASKMHRNFI